MLDTYRVFERLSAVMSPEAAKVLTEIFAALSDELSGAATKVGSGEPEWVAQQSAGEEKRTEAVTSPVAPMERGTSSTSSKRASGR